MYRFILIPSLFAFACGLPCERDSNCPFESTCVEGACRYEEPNAASPELSDARAPVEFEVKEARVRQSLRPLEGAERTTNDAQSDSAASEAPDEEREPMVDAGPTEAEDAGAYEEPVDDAGVVEEPIEDAGVVEDTVEDAGVVEDAGGFEEPVEDAGVVEEPVEDAGPPPPVCPAECDNGCADGVCEIACIGITACRADDVICPDGFDCHVRCEGTSSCQATDIVCPEGGDCEVSCSGAGACTGTDVRCEGGHCQTSCGVVTQTPRLYCASGHTCDLEGC